MARPVLSCGSASQGRDNDALASTADDDSSLTPPLWLRERVAVQAGGAFVDGEYVCKGEMLHRGGVGAVLVAAWDTIPEFQLSLIHI